MYLGVMQRGFVSVESRGAGQASKGAKTDDEEDARDAAQQGVDISSMGRLSSGSVSHPILSRSSIKK